MSLRRSLERIEQISCGTCILMICDPAPPTQPSTMALPQLPMASPSFPTKARVWKRNDPATSLPIKHVNCAGKKWLPSHGRSLKSKSWATKGGLGGPTATLMPPQGPVGVHTVQLLALIIKARVMIPGDFGGYVSKRAVADRYASRSSLTLPSLYVYDDETNLSFTSAFCSFYSYTPHPPPSSSSLTSDLHLISVVSLCATRTAPATSGPLE